MDLNKALVLTRSRHVTSCDSTKLGLLWDVHTLPPFSWFHGRLGPAS